LLSEPGNRVVTRFVTRSVSSQIPKARQMTVGLCVERLIYGADELDDGVK